ncbi:MAG: thiamine pyrophosphate-binding protein [bacterium]|nr:thiamine pyrophosphate-binding protein [bacterium]
MTEMTGGDAAHHALRKLGVEHVFGIVSVHNIPIYDAILRHGGIETISVRHEQAAVHAADGYARATGKLGVAIASTGPGTTNTMTGLYEAGFASSPVLLLTGQAESRFLGKGKGVLHEAENQLDMLRTVTGRAERVTRTDVIASTLVDVGASLRSGRAQPAAIEIPIDLQYAISDCTIPEPRTPEPLEPDPAELERALGLLRKSERRVLWIGGGVQSSGACSEVLQLAERLQAPVLTTVRGRGSIPEDHPLCIGNTTQMPAVLKQLAKADLVLAVGTRFQGEAVGDWRLPMPGKLIHLDVDPSVIGRNYRAHAPLVADARRGLCALLESSDLPSGSAEFLEGMQQARNASRALLLERIGPDFEAIMNHMRETLPDEAIITRDATMAAYYWGNRLFPIRRPHTSIHPTSAAIGPGLPLAIGASVGSGQKTVVIQGDGGFMLHLGELATAAQYQLPVIICVFNDKGYDVLRHIQAEKFEGRTTGVELTTPDFAATARATGIEGHSISGVDAFRAAFSRAVEAEGPVLLDIDMASLQPIRR